MGVAEQRAHRVDMTPWGKARGLDQPYSLLRHLIDVAAVAEALWDMYLSASQRRAIARGLGLEARLPEARAIVALCAALHDIGKLSTGFQAQDKEGWAGLSAALRRDLGLFGVERISHARAGMEAAPGLLRALGYPDGDPRGPLWMISEIIGGHHGRFTALDRGRVKNPRFLGLFGGSAWNEQRLEYARVVHDLVGAPKPPPRCSAPCAILMTGLVILADWLASQESYLRARQAAPALSLSEHLAQARDWSPELLHEAGLVPTRLHREEFTAAHRIPAPNPLQRSVIDDLPGVVAEAGPGILLVTAATGDGKTETALEAERLLSQVSQTRGFAFLLPTMATSDQMYERVSGFVGRQCAQDTSVTLTHSMAWLNSAYTDEALAPGPEVLLCEETTEHGSTEPAHTAVLPKRWLRGNKRPLLAQFAVGTIDQALMAVLPVRHNVLRMLALSGKTFIVDEAHAYDPYTQVLLGRLLNWLGAYGCPVILLSATLPVSVSDRLVKEYLMGAGHKSRELRKKTFRAPYPGWLFVDAECGEPMPMPEPYQREQAAERRIELTVQQESVRHIAPSATEPGQPLPDSARLQVIERLLEPLMGPEGGCALVVCTTVDDAQGTYTRLLRGLGPLGLTGEEIELLHARMPGDDREARSLRVASSLGRSGTRPLRRIVVATQVVEQSLDLDADLVISDLAPLAQLLQRAGRCWRHERWWAGQGRPGDRPRPSWATKTGPRLVVLDPLLDGGSVPRHWGAVYSEFLLRETSAVLAARGDEPLWIPDEVQDLVERVHGDREGRYDWDNPDRPSAWSAYKGENLAKETAGRCVAVPRVSSVRGLDALHRMETPEAEWDTVTRLGADSLRVLCVYQHPDGRTTLDEAGTIPLPDPATGDRLPVADVRTVMRRTIPVRALLLQGRDDAHKPPASWERHPMLADMVLLWHQVHDGRTTRVQVGGRHFRLDGELGLVRS